MGIEGNTLPEGGYFTGWGYFMKRGILSREGEHWEGDTLWGMGILYGEGDSFQVGEGDTLRGRGILYAMNCVRTTVFFCVKKQAFLLY